MSERDSATHVDAPDSSTSLVTSRLASSPPGQPAPVGRFAPSPSGPLHFGSLVSALASYLDIRSQRGTWLLRIDDLDTPRATPGSEQQIRSALEAHALIWDEPVTWQTKHTPNYHAALRKLAAAGRLFFCDCSRRSLRGIPVYPGTCREHRCDPDDLDAHLNAQGERRHAIRLRVPDTTVPAEDELQGTGAIQRLAAAGDYVVFRRDGLVSYQLAVVVDDALTGVTRVVRGADLLPTTARQAQLHQLLGSRAPTWLHVPVLLNQRNTKLSKQAHSLPIDADQASQNLTVALQLLGQSLPSNALTLDPVSLVEWAVQHWQAEQIPAVESYKTFFGW